MRHLVLHTQTTATNVTTKRVIEINKSNLHKSKTNVKSILHKSKTNVKSILHKSKTNVKSILLGQMSLSSEILACYKSCCIKLCRALEVTTLSLCVPLVSSASAFGQ